MKRLLLSTLFTLFAVAAFAQKGTVTGTVVDAETGETVAGAVLEFAPAAAPDKKQYSTSGFKGAVSIPSLAYGEYKLVVSFLGYNNAETIFKVSAAKQDIGKIELRPGVQIETVVKEAKALRTSQKGDTVSYNAGAFKVTDDADVEGLLKKMPGITVSDGTVEAQGESVKKIFVDGKEFFGEDVTTAIKSLPAQAVDRIEVYNKLSDAAEFSGMDDGEGYKALNIVTHANMRQGQFGKLYAGYGYDADTKTEAKNELGVNIIITDDDWFDYIKLFALFLQKAGYSGLLILIDELVNIYKIPNAITRQYNYEKLLTMYNDALQGRARHLGIIMCGTPQCIEDTRRGVYSYEALRSRLAGGRFGREGTEKDLLAPVIRLAPLTYEELLVLTEKLAVIHAELFDYTQKLSEADMVAFIQIEFGRIGADVNITPREVIRDFIELLNIVYQNPQTDVAALLRSESFAFAPPQLEEAAPAEEAFAEFEL